MSAATSWEGAGERAVPDRSGIFSTSGPLAARSPVWPALLGLAALVALLAGPWPGLLVALAAGGGLWAAARRSAAALRLARADACELSEQLLQSQKMAALGELASGIAHEINNPLAIITQEVELLEMALAQADAAAQDACQAGQTAQTAVAAEVRDGIGEIARQVGRCSDITHKMLNFARKVAPICQPADVNRLVEDMVGLVEREAVRQDTRIVRMYGDLPRVTTDPPLLRQVVLNLMNNAMQALERGGMIFVTTRSPEEGVVAIEIRDTGPGIQAEHMDKIFNPFFTTKAPGTGTGLGLAISQRIVNGLGGTLTAQSVPGEGAVFVVRIPAVCGG